MATAPTDTETETLVKVKYAKDTRDQLKALLKKAYPKMRKDNFTSMELSYWRRICVNPDEHKKRFINVDVWDACKLEINKIIATNKADQMKFWASLKTTPSKKLKLSSKSTITVDCNGITILSVTS